MNAFSLNPVSRNLTTLGSVSARVMRPVTIRNPVQLGQTRIGGGEGVIRLPLSPDHSDSHSIVAYLQALSEQFGRDPLIRDYAARLLPRLIANNALGAQIEAVASFVRQSVRYVQDPEGTEYVVSPERMLRDIGEKGYTLGDCDDHVLLLNSLLRSLGLQTLVVGVKLNSRTRFDHVISSVWNGRAWVDVDPCVKVGGAPRYGERLIP